MARTLLVRGWARKGELLSCPARYGRPKLGTAAQVIAPPISVEPQIQGEDLDVHEVEEEKNHVPTSTGK